MAVPRLRDYDFQRPETENYYLKSLRLAKVREQLGGCKAVDSTMFENAILGLLKLGWTVDQVTDAIKREMAE